MPAATVAATSAQVGGVDQGEPAAFSLLTKASLFPP